MSHEQRFSVRVERNLLSPLSDNVGQGTFFLVGVDKREDNFLSTLGFFNFQPIPDAALFFSPSGKNLR